VLTWWRSAGGSVTVTSLEFASSTSLIIRASLAWPQNVAVAVILCTSPSTAVTPFCLPHVPDLTLDMSKLTSTPQTQDLGDRTFQLRPMPPKVIRRAVRGTTRQQIQTVRRTVGRLGDARIQNKTRFRYYYAAACFQYWLTRHGGLPALSFEDLDHQLSEYVEWLWDGGFGKNEAGDCLSGVQHFLRVRRKFPTAWGLFKQWTMLEPPCRAPPLPLEVLFGMVGAAKTAGLMSVCVVLLTAFGCFLRTNEALTLQPWQFHFNSSRTVLVVTLGWTKSAAKRGAVDSIVCDNPCIVRLIAFFLPLCPPTCLSSCRLLVFKRFFRP
jgi:hypothetical protein